MLEADSTWNTRDSFAAGKGSALIIDVGDELTSITPVYDGFVLRKGSFGDFLRPTTNVQV